MSFGATLPYFPSFGMWRSYMHRLLEGGCMSNPEAMSFLESGSDIKPRELARTLVAGAGAMPPVMLSVAIEGGSSTVKRGHPESWRISGHGRWRQMHLGALEAAYGTTPYFRHLYPLISEAIMTTPDGAPFSRLTSELHKICVDFMELEITVASLIELKRCDSERYESILKDNLHIGDIKLSFLDVIFRKGKSAPLSLLQ